MGGAGSRVGGSTAAETLLQHQNILTMLFQTHRVGLHILHIYTHSEYIKIMHFNRSSSWDSVVSKYNKYVRPNFGDIYNIYSDCAAIRFD